MATGRRNVKLCKVPFGYPYALWIVGCVTEGLVGVKGRRPVLISGATP